MPSRNPNQNNPVTVESHPAGDVLLTGAVAPNRFGIMNDLLGRCCFHPSPRVLIMVPMSFVCALQQLSCVRFTDMDFQPLLY